MKTFIRLILLGILTHASIVYAIVLDADEDGYISVDAGGDDCDDSDYTIHPGATEIIGDGIDQDCNGADSITCYIDADQDGYGSSATTIAEDGSCDTWQSESTNNIDCNDADGSIYPAATEVVGDGVDQNCDARELCYVDADNDGFRLTSTFTSSDTDCQDSGEAMAADPTGDCDDTDNAINPNAAEIPGDGIDQDCDGSEYCFVDNDLDLFGSSSTVLSVDMDCSDPYEAGNSQDCDDADGQIHPGASEIAGDGIDQNCDGRDLTTLSPLYNLLLD